MDEFLSMGIAYLGLTPEQFFFMRVGHFYGALDAWAEHEKNKQRFTAELMRMQTTDLLNIQLKKKDRIKPGDLWSFPWDENEVDRKPETDDEIRKHNEAILKRLNRNGR